METHEGSLRKHVEKWGVLEHLECYGMLREELGDGPQASSPGGFDARTRRGERGETGE